MDRVKTQLHVLEREMETADFWQNAEHAREVTKQASDLRNELALWEGFLKEIQDVLDMAELAQGEGVSELHDEIAAKFQELQFQFTKLEFTTLFSGPYDTNNAIVSIHSGSGGTEAQDWAEMLMRMLMRFCEIHGWETQVLWDSYGQEAGIKGITFRVIGRHAYGYFQLCATANIIGQIHHSNFCFCPGHAYCADK